MTRELEGRLLASIPSVGHFQKLEELGITQASFTTYGPMYRYISDIVGENNHIPRLLDLRQTFNLPDHIKRTPEEYDWLLDEFLKLSTVQRIQEVMDRNVDMFGEKPAELVPALVRDLTQLMLPSQHMASLTDQSASKRFDGYAERELQDGLMVGCPTGIRYFDADYRLGWIPGELNGLVGRLYIGKSWMLVWHGALAWQFGKRVLMLSPEMPTDEAEARFDALVCGLNGVPVNITDLYRGYKPSAEQREIAAKIAARGDWITMSSSEGHSFNVSEIPRLIRQFSPDVLLIDGLPLIGGGNRNRSTWEQVKEISGALKNIAIGMNVIMLVAHQANRGAHNTARPPGLHEVAYGDAFAQDCDRLIVYSKPTKPENRLRVTIQKFRKGQPLPGGSEFEFLPGSGIIRELDPSEQKKNTREAQTLDVLEDELTLAIP